jgi:hypothetical protein
LQKGGPIPFEEQEFKGGKENGQDQFIARKAGSSYLANARKGLMDIVVQPALGHLLMG